MTTTLRQFATDETFESYISVRESSIPGPGSPTFDSDKLDLDIPVTKVIKHRNEDVTAVTQYGYVKFWHKRTLEWFKKHEPDKYKYLYA
jgi:hypothetical protein